MQILKSLFDFIKSDNIDAVINFLDNNPDFDVSQSDEYGFTLLHIAARKSNLRMVEILVNDYDARIDIRNLDNRTPLHMATIYGSTDTAYCISPNGENSMRITDSGKIIELMIDKASHALLMEDNDRKTPIDYYLIHSDIDNNSMVHSKYNGYQRNRVLFQRLKEKDPEDYNLTMEIYFGIKQNR